MAERTRTTKRLAQRIDLDYFKTLRGIPRWRRVLSVAFAAAGLAWLGWHGVRGSPAPYNAGPVARSHALFGNKCAACHVSTAGFEKTVGDRACLACHDGPIHHAEQTFSPACSDCHVEHKGLLRLAATSDRACAQCHADLAAKDKISPPRFIADISDFNSNHPEFSPLRSGQKDPGTIKFNHQVHLKVGLRSPKGPTTLNCDYCHQSSGSSNRALMSPIDYEKHCAFCHPLQFDRRFTAAAPHKEPKVVYEFVSNKLTEYIANHPDQIHTVDEPDKRLPARPLPPVPRNAQEWIAQRLSDAQLLLWRKACKECHQLSYPNGPDSLPVVAKAAITARWLPHAVFDHEAHQLVACNSCHSRANTSKETSDVLIPGIQVCRQCHRSDANAAEARCFECHTYHDWSKEKRVNAGFTIHSLAE